MSKTKGNVVNPSEIIGQGYGADALRLAITFLAPYDQTTPWSPETVAGTHRFLQRVWTLVQEYLASGKQSATDVSEELKRAQHAAIKRVSVDLHQLGFNTAIAALMECVNDLYKIKAEHGFNCAAWEQAITALLRLLAPFAPHISEELWAQLGQKGSVHTSQWPQWDDKYLVTKTMTIAVQVNGKLRGEVEVDAAAPEDAVVSAAKNQAKIASYIGDKPVSKTIYVAGKLINFVV